MRPFFIIAALIPFFGCISISSPAVIKIQELMPEHRVLAVAEPLVFPVVFERFSVQRCAECSGGHY